MENGYAGGIDTNSLLLARGVGGYGYGGFGGGYGSGGGILTAEAMANGTATNARVEAGNAANAAGVENLLDQNQFTATNKNVTDGHQNICDKLTDGEFRTSDRLRDIEREMNANARTAAECCCKLQLQSCEDKAQILAAVADSKATALAVESRGIERQLNATQAELISLRTQVACGCCPPR